MKPPTIVRVITRLGAGGPPVHAALLTREMRRLGYRTLLVTGSCAPGESEMSYLLGPDDEVIRIEEMSRSVSPWLDLVALRYAARLNTLTALVITKLDVLSGFDRIAVATSYRGGEDGAEFEDFPYHQTVLHHTTAGLTELSGWSEDLGECRSASDLPDAAREYLQFISEHTGVPVAL